jgi:hypothetical protein
MIASRTSNVDQSVYADEHPYLLEDPVIGRDVLELVSSAMYIDPMTVYREYVQNAADAIDEARRSGQLGDSELGRLDISVDPSTRTVRIRDNGSGIEWSDFLRRLTALGASPKRNTSARGFRGVGRLAGLGYAQELIFRSRIDGESLVSEVRWDCRRLKAAFRSTEVDKGVAALIRDIVVANRVAAGSFPLRFFEVELRGIVRLRNDRLMSPMAIGEYLSQVAPVPFSPDFRFGSDIAKALSPIVNLSNLAIKIEGMEGPIYRPHRDVFVGENKRKITFEDIQIVNIPGVDGDLAAVAWILHHDYEGAVPNGAFCKGLRLRSGNIQVGDHALLEELFPEPRFNMWSVGEVHVVDRRISPNGRRDHFDQNAHLLNLLNQLTPTARDIARRCRTSSIRRKWLREFDLHRRTAKEKLGIARQGSLAKAKRNVLVASIEPALLQMEKISGLAALADDRPDELLAKVRRLRAEAASLMSEGLPEASPLATLTPRQRSMYEQMFSLVYECSANRVAAKALVDRIIAKIRSGKGEKPTPKREAKRAKAAEKSNRKGAAAKLRSARKVAKRKRK